jgi:hypothetical protein
VNVPRLKQVKASGIMNGLMQVLMSLMRSMVIFINSATFSTFIYVEGIEQNRFAVDIMPCFIYLFYVLYCLKH